MISNNKGQKIMRKVISIILTILFIQIPAIATYSSCNIPTVDTDELNFEKIKKGTMRVVTQKFKDKTVEMVRYEATKDIKDILNEKIRHAWEKLIRSWNSKAGPEAVVYLGLRMWEIIKNINATDSEALKKQLEKLKEEFKKEGYIKVPLTDGEKLEAIEDGKAKAGIATGISLGLGSTLGLAVGAKMGSFIANLAIASGGTGAAVATAAGAETAAVGAVTATSAVTGGAIAVVSAPIAVGAVLGFAVATYLSVNIYNCFFSEKDAENARIGIDKYANLKKSVSKSVCDHDWMGNNLLIMSTTKEPGCSNVATTFEDVEGVKYKISKKNLDNAFANLECDLIGAPLEDCKERALRSIECLWKNLDDVKECDNVANIYCNGYKGEFADRFVDKETKFLTNSNEGK